MDERREKSIISSVKSELKTCKYLLLLFLFGSCQRNPFVDPYETFFSVLYMIRNRPLPTLSELATESENTRNKSFSVLFSFMTVFAVETRGFSNTSGNLERRHQEENFVPTWAVLQCKTGLQQLFFKFATQPASHRTVFSRTGQ